MFEVAEVGSKTDKATYKREVPRIRNELLDVQRRIAESGLAPVIHIGGVEGPGKGEVVDLLLAWMDARGIEAHALWEPSDEERERPRFWRFWRLIPARGTMAILLGSWYTEPIIQRAHDAINDVTFEREMRRIRDFERMLALENVPLVKIWLHMAKPVQRKYLKKLRGDPRRRWLVTEQAWEFFRRYDEFRAVSEQAITLTSTGAAPWHIVEAGNTRYRNLTVTTTVVQALREALDEWRAREAARARPGRRTLPKPRPANVIRQLDLTRALTDEQYEERLERYQAKLSRLSRALHDAGRSLLLVFEGPDAAGKGGAIRRLTAAMDARLYRVISVAAPTDEEAAHPYLWRFWRHLPRQGRITIYDRSWYGRVLVERVEGFAARDDWQRAYAEINEFEAQLTEFGTILVKFWLAISPEEQLRRFEDRQTTPYKQYKLTEEDWRNRKKWDGYEAAACDMIERTSTGHAPWVLVEAEDKRWARVSVLKAVCKHVRRSLKEGV